MVSFLFRFGEQIESYYRPTRHGPNCAEHNFVADNSHVVPVILAPGMCSVQLTPRDAESAFLSIFPTAVSGSDSTKITRSGT
ncbi:hypothetical protein P3T16_004796 [Paraburkholderia sp. GAS42]